MVYTDKQSRIVDVLSILADDELIWMWNQRCENDHYEDEIIYSMDCLDDLYSTEGKKVSEILNDFDNFNSWASYFHVDDVWGFESIDDLYSILDLDEIAVYMEDNDDDLGNDEVREILDESDDDLDEEEEEEADEE